MKIKTFLTVLAMAAIMALNAGQALAAYATADTVINWSTLTFSSPVTWDYRESYVETSLDGVNYTNQQTAGFVNLLQTDYSAGSEVLASTLKGLDGAYANVGDKGYGYAYADLFGLFTPDHDMSLTVSFDYELFGEVSGSNAFSDNYVFLILGDQAYDDFLTLSVSGANTVTRTASVTANLLAGETYGFAMGAAAEASTVPLPGAVWLLGSGLLGLAGLRRKNRSV